MPFLTDDELLAQLEAQGDKGKETIAKIFVPTFGLDGRESVIETTVTSDVSTRYPGDKTYQDKPYGAPDLTMEKTFFYYIGASDDGDLVTYLYEKEGTADLPKQDIQQWIADAKSANPTLFKEKNIDDVRWGKPCFLAFCVDILSWTMLGDDGSSDDVPNKALYFLKHEPANKKPWNQNHSFFEAKTFDINGSRVLALKNYHLKAPKGAGGKKYERRKAGDAEDHYKFDIYMRVPLEHDNTRKLTVVIDPGGRNMGP